METTIYRLIPYEYEAVEVSVILAARSNGTLDKAPKWIRDAIYEGKVQFPATAYCIQLNTFAGVAQLSAPRDYLMRGPRGQLRTCPPETLAEMYEKIGPRPPHVPQDRCPECTSTGGMHAVGCSEAEN